ncbi:MAG: HAD-IA family hydrolase, partial [Ktedonobacteraceae bacterium]|nr:HAD-IA family hydrolase [Ktedonobacteraceae bacterium]
NINGRAIRCILFDIGDTLWTRISDTTALQQLEEQASRRALDILAQHLPPSTCPANDHALDKQLYKAIGNELHRQKKRQPLREPDMATIITAALLQLGFPPIDYTVGTILAEALRIRNIQARALFPDVPASLAELRSRGFVLGIVTNRSYGGQPFYEDLREFDLLDYFDYQHMAISADLGLRKPDPGIFLHALNSLAIPPQKAAMVGDSLRADVYGAHQLGMLTIWKPRLVLRYRAAETGQQPLSKDHLFTYIQQHEQQWDYSPNDYVRPDLTIEHISDLLDILAKAGPQ